MTAPTTPADVVIVGFGPVGAALAGLLGRRGWSVVVLDRERDVFGLPRAAHIDHSGLRTLQELGLLDTILPTMVQNDGLDFVTASGELLLSVPGRESSVSGVPASMYFFQPDLDRTIRSAVEAMPTVSVHLGTEVTALDEVDGQGRVTATGPDGLPVVIEARWVVGCDGAWSVVREQTRLELEDLEFEEKWLVVDLLLTGGLERLDRRAVCKCDPRRPTYSIPMPSRRHRFEFMVLPGESPDITRDAMADVVRPWLSPDQYEIERSAVYNFHGLVASQWRRGAFLLAGDAAHQMPPFLGQGMCSGLRDAANLAWKLDLVLRDAASPTLLDTYGAERRIHVREVVVAAVGFGRLICTIDPVEAAERDRVMLADPRPPAERMPFVLPALEPGPLVLEGGGQLFVQPAADNRRLDDLVGQRFAVFGRDEESLSSTRSWWVDRLGAYVAAVAELGGFGPAVARWLERANASAVVVRPDRYVLWAGHDLDRPQCELDRLLTSSGAAVSPAGL